MDYFLKKFTKWLNLIKILVPEHILMWMLIWEKKQKNDFQKDFSLSWWIMQRLEKLWKMWENIETSNSSQQIEEGID